VREIFKVLMAVTVKTNAFWSVTPVVWWKVTSVSEDIASALKMEAAVSSESLVKLCAAVHS
jgi:hypothetical protein